MTIDGVLSTHENPEGSVMTSVKRASRATTRYGM